MQNYWRMAKGKCEWERRVGKGGRGEVGEKENSYSNIYAPVLLLKFQLLSAIELCVEAVADFPPVYCKFQNAILLPASALAALDVNVNIYTRIHAFTHKCNKIRLLCRPSL